MGKRNYRPSLIERTAEQLARQMLLEYKIEQTGEYKLDWTGRESSLLPLAWCKSQRLAPGLFRVWLGLEYRANRIDASAMAFRLTILNPKTFARAGYTGIDGGRLAIIEAHSSPFHQHRQLLMEGWAFDESILDERDLWKTEKSPLLDPARLQGTLIAMKYDSADAPIEYEVRMRNETQVVLGKRVLQRWQFSGATEYVYAWHEFDKLKRRAKARLS